MEETYQMPWLSEISLLALRVQLPDLQEMTFEQKRRRSKDCFRVAIKATDLLEKETTTFHLSAEFRKSWHASKRYRISYLFHQTDPRTKAVFKNTIPHIQHATGSGR